MTRKLQAAREMVRDLVEVLAGVDEPLSIVARPPVPPSRSAERPVAESERPARREGPKASEATVEDGAPRKLMGNALKIAQIAAGYGERGIERKLLAVLCGMTIGGGGWNGRVSEARAAGAIETVGDRVVATAAGIAQYAGTFRAPRTTGEVLTLWRPRLSGKALEIFDHLVSLRGKPISRAELAKAVGMSHGGGGFNGRLSEARATQLLVEESGTVAINRSLLFM